MRKSIFILITFNFFLNDIIAQIEFEDPCFSSGVAENDFESTPSLINIQSADLLIWNGFNWYGGPNQSNIWKPPPGNQEDCMAIFLGSAITWTSGGEAFAIKLVDVLRSGQAYSIPITYISHGIGHDGHFSPTVYSSENGEIANAIFIDNLLQLELNGLTTILNSWPIPNKMIIDG